MGMPRVSVIIPTYNRAALCLRAVESVLDQTYQDFEVIVADDGSTDNTREVLPNLSGKIRYLYLDHGGRSRARNQAIASAAGEYIAFLDSDDVFFPYTLETQVEHLDANIDYGMVYGPAICFNEGGEHIFTYETGGSGWLYPKIALYLPLVIILCTVMVRRSVLDLVGGFDERMERFEDTDMWRRISRKCQILAVDKPLCKILTHSGNAMQHPKRELGCIKYYTRKVFREDYDIDSVFKRKGAASLFIHYSRAIRDQNPNSWAASRFALWAIFNQPFQWSYYPLLLPKRASESRCFNSALYLLRHILSVLLRAKNFLIFILRLVSEILAILIHDPRDFFRRVKKRLSGSR